MRIGIKQPVNKICIDNQCNWLNQLSNGIGGTNGELSVWCVKSLTCKNNNLLEPTINKTVKEGLDDGRKRI